MARTLNRGEAISLPHHIRKKPYGVPPYGFSFMTAAVGFTPLSH